MPPRKRAASKPVATEEHQTADTPETGDQLTAAPDDGAPDEPTSEEAPDTEANAPSDPLDAESSGNPEVPPAQAGDQPCSECMPNGWPVGATAVGCIHGNWTRDA